MASGIAGKLPLKRLAVGAAGLAAAQTIRSGLDRAKEYNAEFHPKYAESTMTPDNLMQKVAEAAPEKYHFLTQSSQEVRESPFREEIVFELDGLLKKAAAPGMWGSLGTAAAGLGGVAATGVAMSLAGDMYDAVKRGITKSRNYKTMMLENPDLGEADPRQVQKAFATLHHFNPEFAGDPTVAGSFVRRQAALGEFDHKQLTDLIGARKNLADIKKLPSAGKVPWDSAGERKMKGLQITQLEQQTDPEFQRAMREPDAAQQRLWEAQASKATQDANFAAHDRINQRAGLRGRNPRNPDTGRRWGK